VPRSARHAHLETRTGRARLKVRRAPYFVKIAKGLRLGYYRGATAGTWIGRRYLGGGSYETDPLGLADDTTEADELKVLDYWQAQEAVRRWAERNRLADVGMTRRGPYSVSDAVRDYLEEISAEKTARPVRDARYIFENSVLPEATCLSKSSPPTGLYGGVTPSPLDPLASERSEMHPSERPALSPTPTKRAASAKQPPIAL
jgi:hypothetical protein